MSAIPVAPINRIPPGVLNLLGIQNGGRNPQILSDVLLPAWDLRRDYVEGAAVFTQSLSFDILATGFLSVFVVPAGEIWHVHEFGFQTAPIIAGNNLSTQIAMRGPDGGTVVTLMPNDVATSTVGDRLAQGLIWGALLQSNTALGLYTTRYAGAGVSTIAGARVTRIRV